jgi:hypothetical protein
MHGHYRKIWCFRAPILCRGLTHGIENYTVSQPAQRTANTNRTANINETYGKISTHGTLQQDTWQNINTQHSAIKAHGK